MRLQSLHIKNFRGIKDLRLELAARNFVVEGPNGTGKSGVVDAIEFAFTGRMGRFEGAGTSALSVRSHGPHVDHRGDLQQAFVEVAVVLPDKRAAVIRRNLAKPRDPVITPADAAGEISWLMDHPEIALSRRDLIRLIVLEAGERSKAIQALLKLDSLESTRKSFTTAVNSFERDAQAATRRFEVAKSGLLSALGTSNLESETVCTAVNARRQVLGLDALTELSATSRASGGLVQRARLGRRAEEIDKCRAIKDVQAVLAALEEHSTPCSSVLQILDALAVLDANPQTERDLAQRELVETGLDLVTSESCPLCDLPWPAEELRAHLREKRSRAAEAEAFASALDRYARALKSEAQALCDLLDIVACHARALGLEDVAAALSGWRDDLAMFAAAIANVAGLRVARDRFASGWTAGAPAALAALQALRDSVDALPEPSDVDAAWDYLLLCDERFAAYWAAEQAQAAADTRASLASAAKTMFDATSERHLASLYEAVEQDMVRFYRFLNDDDEQGFAAKLDAKPGKLNFEVAFHDRGLFPPGAYHSEGHQDGMGLCLYLALVKRLFGDRFTFGVLDDVVMSVDKGHRKRVCRLLQQEFPNTQFVLTTHDDVWLHQMIASGLVAKKSVKRFRGWTLEHGPLVHDYKDDWDSIAEYLEREEVPAAAARLRRHLEQAAGELCEALRASVPYRRDGDHDLGDLLPAATGRWTKLLQDAKKVAGSWSAHDQVEALTVREKIFKDQLEATRIEQWAVNKCVHYNDWASLSAADFAPVVSAYSKLLASLRCGECQSWLVLTPRKGDAEAIICECKEVCINLRRKAA